MENRSGVDFTSVFIERPDVTGIAVSGENVYVSGNAYVQLGEFFRTAPIYWKNGEYNIITTPEKSDECTTKSLTIAGNDIYIAGRYGGNSYGSKACFWKNGIAETLTVPGQYYNASSASSLAVNGNDVYVAGNIELVQAEGRFSSRAIV